MVGWCFCPHQDTVLCTARRCDGIHSFTGNRRYTILPGCRRSSPKNTRLNHDHSTGSELISKKVLHYDVIVPRSISLTPLPNNYASAEHDHGHGISAKTILPLIDQKKSKFKTQKNEHTRHTSLRSTHTNLQEGTPGWTCRSMIY